MLVSASKRRQATCIPAVIDAAAPVAGDVVRVAFMIVPAESLMSRPEYAPNVKGEKPEGKSTVTVCGVIFT